MGSSTTTLRLSTSKLGARTTGVGALLIELLVESKLAYSYDLMNATLTSDGPLQAYQRRPIVQMDAKTQSVFRSNRK
jgi:hypothetical protein